MDTEKEFLKIKANMHKWHKKGIGEWFPDAHGEGSEKQQMDMDANAFINGNRDMALLPGHFREMSLWKINQAQRALLFEEDTQKFYSDFCQFSEYAFLWISLNKETYAYLNMKDVGFAMCSCFLSGWIDKYAKIAESMLYSIDNYQKGKKGVNKGCSIRDGMDVAPSIWFLLDLYCMSNNTEYNKKKANLPTQHEPYEEILNNWNTTDLSLVDQYVYKMCEIHIMKSINMEDDWEQEFNYIERRMLPFEIQFFLMLRRKNGLDSPDTFSHFFMHEPLSKAFPMTEALSFPELSDTDVNLLKMSSPTLYGNYVSERGNG